MKLIINNVYVWLYHLHVSCSGLMGFVSYCVFMFCFGLLPSCSLLRCVSTLYYFIVCV
jgi:hypothetical protein